MVAVAKTKTGGDLTKGDCYCVPVKAGQPRDQCSLQISQSSEEPDLRQESQTGLILEQKSCCDTSSSGNTGTVDLAPGTRRGALPLGGQVFAPQKFSHQASSRQILAPQVFPSHNSFPQGFPVPETVSPHSIPPQRSPSRVSPPQWTSSSGYIQPTPAPNHRTGSEIRPLDQGHAHKHDSEFYTGFLPTPDQIPLRTSVASYTSPPYDSAEQFPIDGHPDYHTRDPHSQYDNGDQQYPLFQHGVLYDDHKGNLFDHSATNHHYQLEDGFGLDRDLGNWPGPLEQPINTGSQQEPHGQYLTYTVAK